MLKMNQMIIQVSAGPYLTVKKLMLSDITTSTTPCLSSYLAFDLILGQVFEIKTERPQS